MEMDPKSMVQEGPPIESATSTDTIIDENNPNVNNSNKKRKTHRLKQRFQVVRKLGQGTYGKVQLAINNETGQEVAIKTIKKSKVESDQDLIRIRREIQIMSSIHHPHITHIYEVFENKDKIVLVMQYASGGELYDYVSYHKVLSDSDARRLFRQIATAIYYCHKNKICHRDLKLENILLDEKGNAKIADFGLSNVFDEKHFLQTFCGSPLYASPEIVRGLPYFGPEVDCWSLGVLLYTLVYGAMPFDGSNFKKLVKQISESSYYEPPNKSAASDLIRKLLKPDPKERANIVTICTDEWVNQDYEHSLLQVAEDLSNLTPVRCDMLTALAPTSPIDKPTVESNKTKIEDATSAEQHSESNKRPVDNTSFSANASVSDVCQPTENAPKTKSTKKKTKRVESKEKILENETKSKTTDEKSVESNQLKIKENQESEQIENKEILTETKENDKILDTTSATESIIKTTEDKTSESPTSKSANGSTSSLSSPKRPGRLSIPKLWENDSNPPIDVVTSPDTGIKRVPFIPVGLKVSEAKKVIERRCSTDSTGKSIKRRDSDTSELSENKGKSKELKKYANRSLSLNIHDTVKGGNRESIKVIPIKVQMESKKTEIPTSESNDSLPKTRSDESESSKPSTPISEEDRSLAKQIIRKNIARAKLMEKSQISVTTDSEPTTPLVSIENSNISIIKNTPKTTLGDQLISEPINTAQPITRSYKKVTFTKDGACITESGKFYTHEGKDGYMTRVEKKSMVTHIVGGGGGGNDEHDPALVNIQRSDSQSSSGSTDIFDDIFDDHWTGDVFSNMKSLFNNIFENSSRRFNERKSLRSRAESLERNSTASNASDWLSQRRQNRKSFFSNDDENDGDQSLLSNASKSIFDSHGSIFSKTLFSKSLKSSFDRRLEDMMSSTGKRESSITKIGGYPLPRSTLGSRFSRESSLHRDLNESFESRFSDLLGNSGRDDQQQSSTRRRVEQWLGDSDSAKDIDTYGTIGPKNFRRYVRTMTSSSNDSSSNIVRRVHVSNESGLSREQTNENIESLSFQQTQSSTVPRDSEIEMRFNLDQQDNVQILNRPKACQNVMNESQSESSINTTLSDSIKIPETSSLLEQLRTFGYQNLVNRRLSESSSTEDIENNNTSNQEINSNLNKMTGSKTEFKRNMLMTNESSQKQFQQSTLDNSETKISSFRRQLSNERSSVSVTGSERRRPTKDLDLMISNQEPLSPTTLSSQISESESVQDRIHRKSYYSRFNEDSRNSYTVRQRRRSMTRMNEQTSSEFFSASSSSSSIRSSRNQLIDSPFSTFDADRMLSSSGIGSILNNVLASSSSKILQSSASEMNRSASDQITSRFSTRTRSSSINRSSNIRINNDEDDSSKSSDRINNKIGNRL